MHEDRETSVAPEVVTGRSGKADGRKAGMHAAEESDSGVVPMNQPNKGGRPQAEAGEGRPGIQENIAQSQEFGRFAAVDRRKRGEKKPETFTFLEFIHQCGTSPRGLFMVWRQTANKRMVAKLKQIKQKLRRRMHEPMEQIGAWLRSVSQGFYQYHAVPGNLRAVNASDIGCGACGEERFAIAVSGQMSVGGASAHSSIAGCLPRASCIPTPTPASTLLIQDKSRMREFRTYGSVRGVPGNRHPYRDRSAAVGSGRTREWEIANMPAGSQNAARRRRHSRQNHCGYPRR
jgi:hypothetical protein